MIGVEKVRRDGPWSGAHRPADTAPAVAAEVGRRVASMSVGARAELTGQLCHDVELLARAGILAQHPEFDDLQVRHELARRRFGTELADAAFAGLVAES
jgi:hypothetical protein